MGFNYLRKAFSQNMLQLGLIGLSFCLKVSAINLATFDIISHYQWMKRPLLKLLTLISLKL